MKELLLGFDIRINDFSEWPEKRRGQFLLRPEVLLPKSVDDMVWARHPIVEELLEDELVERNWEFHPFHLSLWLLQEALVDNQIDGVSIIVITILPEDDVPPMFTAFGSDHSRGYDKRATYAFGEWKERPEGAAFRPLGYDVADEWETSGLSNCGYRFPEDSAIKLEYGPMLNEHGLFTTIEDALPFVDVTDERVEEHYPFFVYGLHELEL